MIEKNLNRLSATRLRAILISTILVGILIIGAGFYFIQAHLHSFAVEVSHANEDAATSDSDVATLERLKEQLEEDEATIERTQKIVADSKSYEYQDQIITDLNAYAARAGVAITSFTFASSDQTKRAGTSSSSTAPNASTSIAKKSTAGLKSTTVSVTLATPTGYNNLMNFVHSIEQNLTKMQLASLSLTKGAGNNEVSINTLEIEVYIK